MASPAEPILEFVIDAAARDEQSVLVTLTRVIGSSAREPGTQMAVRQDGAHAGSLSAGCVEAAIVAEAVRVLAAARAELIRFGEGSPYIDVRLPCGGGMELLFTPNPDATALASARETLLQRRPAALRLGLDGSVAPASEDARAGWTDDHFTVTYRPKLKLLIVGHGAEAERLAILSRAFGAACTVLTPDEAPASALKSDGIEAHELLTNGPSPRFFADAFTAVVFLFHDHDWERALIAQALGSRAFFIGAMGSSTTHERRCYELLAFGCAEEDVARVRSPLGLIASARDPETLALSALAQIVEEYRRAGVNALRAASAVPHRQLA